jgi:predicted HTH domain antitoxin
MTISFEIPSDIAGQIRCNGSDPSLEAKEAFLVELYRRDRITHYQLGRALGLDRFETDDLLKRHDVPLDITAEDVEEEAASLRDVKPS